METLRAIRDELAKNIGTHQGATSKRLFIESSFVDGNVLVVDVDEKYFTTGGTDSSPVGLGLWLKVHGILFREDDKEVIITGFHALARI